MWIWLGNSHQAFTKIGKSIFVQRLLFNAAALTAGSGQIFAINPILLFNHFSFSFLSSFNKAKAFNYRKASCSVHLFYLLQQQKIMAIAQLVYYYYIGVWHYAKYEVSIKWINLVKYQFNMTLIYSNQIPHLCSYSHISINRASIEIYLDEQKPLIIVSQKYKN